jgi:hypothetical protein
MFENRKSARSKMVLPVKISVGSDSQLAHTLDISSTGARIGALRSQLQAGTIVTLRRGAKKANFRVQWVRQLGPNEAQAGIECLESQEQFWGIDLEQQDKHNMDALMSLLSGKSTSPKGVGK